MRKIKKISIILSVVIILSLLTGCGETNVTSVEKKDINKVENTEKKEETKQDETTQKVYGVGERVVVDDKYALEILAVQETDERNQYSEKEVAQVLIIDYLYENIGEEDKDIYISDMEFKFVDSGGNMCTTYPVEGNYDPQPTPLGAKNISSMVIGTVEKSDEIQIMYYDNMFDSKTAVEFKVAVGDSVDIESRLQGKLPEYENMFELGDVIEVKTEDGDYTLSIDSVELIEERNQFSRKQPKNVFRIKYTYSNISKEDELYISDMDFRVIDENGNMVYTYPADTTYYPQPTVKGAKCSAEMVFGTHTESDTLILCYTDNMFSNISDFKIIIRGIRGN